MLPNIQSLDSDDVQSHKTIIYMDRFDRNSVIISSLLDFDESSQIATKHNFNDFNLYQEYEVYIKKFNKNQNKSRHNSEVNETKNGLESAPAVIEKERTSLFARMTNKTNGDVIFKTQEIHLSFSKYHMLIPAGDESYTCLFCDDKIDSKEECKQHVETEKHKTRLQNQEFVGHFTDNIIRRVKDNVFHCGICNITVTDEHLTAHVQKDINHNRVKHFRQSRYDSVCETIKYGQDYPFSDRLQAPNGEMLYCELKVLLNLFHYNMLIPNGDDTYVCLCCNVKIDTMSECRKHVVTQHHRKHLRGQQYIKEFSDNIVRRIQDKYFHCGICNDIILEEHMANHVQNEKKHETLKKYSKACALHFAQLFVGSNTEIDLNNFVEIQIEDEKILMPKYRWHMCFKLPRKFFCSLCILGGDVELLEDHLKSFDHLTRLGKCQILPEYGFSVVRTLNKDYYHCGVCNLYTNIPIINNHINKPKHKSYVKILLEFNEKQTDKTKTEEAVQYDDQGSIEKQKAPKTSEKVVIDIPDEDIIVEYKGYKFCLQILSYNTIVKAKNDFYCVCCSATVDACELHDHIKMKKHKKALSDMEILDDYVDNNFVRKIHSESTMWAHCGFCNTRMTYNTKHIEDHFKTFKHVENSIHRLELLAKNLSETTKNYKLTPKKIVPPTAQYSKSEIYSQVIEILGHRYQLNLQTFKAWHTIRGWGMYFHCCFVCQTLLTHTTMYRHTRSVEHKENLKNSIIMECYGTHCLKLIDWTHTVYCMFCNDHIDNVENGDIDSHITSQSHINKYKIGVTKLENRDEVKSRIPINLQNLLDAKILKPESKNEEGYKTELQPESKNEVGNTIELKQESVNEKGYEIELKRDSKKKEAYKLELQPGSKNEEGYEIELKPEYKNEEGYEIELKPKSKNEEGYKLELKPESENVVGYKSEPEKVEYDICSEVKQHFAPVRISEDDSKKLDIFIARISHILKVDACTPEDLPFLTLVDKAQIQHFNIVCEIIDNLKNNALIRQVYDAVNGKITHIENLTHENLKPEVIENRNIDTSKYLILDFIKEKMLVTYNAWNTIIEQNNYCRSCNKYFKTDLKGHCSEETHIDKAFGRIIKLIDGSPGRHVSKKIVHCILCDSEMNWLSLNCHIELDTHMENFASSKDAVRYVDKSQVKSFPYERYLVSAECTQMEAGKCKEGNLVLLRFDHTEMVVTYEAWNRAKENIAICFVCNDRSTKSDRRDIVTHCNNGSHRHEMNSKPTIDNCIRQIKKNKFQCFLCDFYMTRVQIKEHVQMTIHEDNEKVARILGENLLNSGIQVINYAQNTSNDIYTNNSASIKKIIKNRRSRRSKKINAIDNMGSSEDDDSDYCICDIIPDPTTIETKVIEKSLIPVECNTINKVVAEQEYENNLIPNTSREVGYTKMIDLQETSNYNTIHQNKNDSRDISDSKEMLIINRSILSTDDELKEIKVNNKLNDFISLQNDNVIDAKIITDLNSCENKYCHVCDMFVPTQFHREHVNSEHHKTIAKMMEILLERMKNSISHIPSNSKNDNVLKNVKYCSTCNCVLSLEEFSKHNDSSLHKANVNKTIVMQSVLNLIERPSSLNTECVSNLDGFDAMASKSADDKKDEVILENDALLQQKQSTLIPITAEIQGEIVEDGSERNKNDINDSANSVSTEKYSNEQNSADYDEEAILIDLTESEATFQIGVKKMKINKLSYYGIYPKIDNFWCVLCKRSQKNSKKEEHLMSDIHKKQLTEVKLKGVDLIRYLTNGKAHCAVCHLIMDVTKLNDHLATEEHKTNRSEATLFPKNESTEPENFQKPRVCDRPEEEVRKLETSHATITNEDICAKGSIIESFQIHMSNGIADTSILDIKSNLQNQLPSIGFHNQVPSVNHPPDIKSTNKLDSNTRNMSITQASPCSSTSYICTLCNIEVPSANEKIAHEKSLDHIVNKAAQSETKSELHSPTTSINQTVSTKLENSSETQSPLKTVIQNEFISFNVESKDYPYLCSLCNAKLISKHVEDHLKGSRHITNLRSLNLKSVNTPNTPNQSPSIGFHNKVPTVDQNQSPSIGFHNKVSTVDQPLDVKTNHKFDSITQNMSIIEAKPGSSTNYFCTVRNIEVPSANEKIAQEKSLDHIINKAGQSVTKNGAQSPSTSINQIVNLENSSELQPPLKTVIQNEFISFNVESKDYPYLCSLCNAKLISKHVEDHLKGSRHITNLRSLNLKSVNTPNTQNQSPSIGFHNEVPTVNKPLDVKTTHKFDFTTQNMSIIKAKPCSSTSYFCAACNIEVPSANEKIAHEKSLDHITNTAAQSITKSVTQSPSLSINHTAILGTSSESQPPCKTVNVNEFITVNSDFNAESYSCSLCNIQIPSLNHIEGHLKGSRHMTKLKELSSMCDHRPNVKTNNKSLSENISADRPTPNIALTPSQKSFPSRNSTSSSKNSNVTDSSKVVTFLTNANVKDSSQSISAQQDVIADNIVKPVICGLNTQNIPMIETKQCSSTVSNIQVSSINKTLENEKRLEDNVNATIRSENLTQLPSVYNNKNVFDDRSIYENSFVTFDPESKLNPYFCFLCKMPVSSLKNVEEHLRGLRHAQNLENRSLVDQLTQNIATRPSSPASNLLKLENTHEYACEACNVKVPKNIWKQHVQGRTHRLKSTQITQRVPISSANEITNLSNLRAAENFTTNAKILGSSQSLPSHQEISQAKPCFNTSYKCTLCNIQMSSIDEKKSHVCFSYHIANSKVQITTKNNNTQSPSIPFSQGTVSESTSNSQLIAKVGTKNDFILPNNEPSHLRYRCSLCDVKLPSEYQVQEHLKGATHIHNLKAAFSTDVGATKSQRQSLSTQPNQSHSCETSSQLNISDGEYNFISLNTKNDNYPYLCTLCNVKINSAINLKEHIGGARHKQNIINFNAKTTNKPQVNVNSTTIQTNTPVYNTKQSVSITKGTTNIGSNSNQAESSINPSKHSEPQKKSIKSSSGVENKVEPQYKCVICKVNVPLANIEEHNRGQNHIQKEKNEMLRYVFFWE